MQGLKQDDLAARLGGLFLVPMSPDDGYVFTASMPKAQQVGSHLRVPQLPSLHWSDEKDSDPPPVYDQLNMLTAPSIG